MRRGLVPRGRKRLCTIASSPMRRRSCGCRRAPVQPSRQAHRLQRVTTPIGEIMARHQTDEAFEGEDEESGEEKDTEKDDDG